MQNWYALNSKPNAERLVCEVLAARQIETYLPIWQPPARNRHAAPPRPFFPSYLFVYVDLGEVGLSALQYVPGVRKLVCCGDSPVPVEVAVIERIRLRLDSLGQTLTDSQGKPLAPGDHVRITAGPLAGLDAIFDGRLTSQDRVRLLVNFLQRGARVEVERQYVQKTPRPADERGKLTWRMRRQ